MLLGILTLYFQYRTQFGVSTFEVARLMNLKMAPNVEMYFLLGALHRLRDQDSLMFPFQTTWLPDAHVEAPHGCIGGADQCDAQDDVWVRAFSLPLACTPRPLGW